jgi:hypothetical protein
MALKVAKTKRYGTPDPRWPEADMLNERRYTVGDVLGQTLQQFSYSYDFGGGWDHTIAVEQRLVGVEGKNTWPMCIDGENACPSEDVGARRATWTSLKLCTIRRTRRTKTCGPG